MEEDLDGIDPNDELYATSPTRVRKMISFDWNAGYVSPFVASDSVLADTIMTRTGVGTGSVVVDLGSGDGTFLVAAGKKGAHAIGYELSSELNGTAAQRARDAGVEDLIEIRAQDLTQVDVVDVVREAWGSNKRAHSTIDVLVMYLLPEFLGKIAPSVKEWLRRAGEQLLVVTVRWPLMGFSAVNEKEGLNDGYYIYSITSCAIA